MPEKLNNEEKAILLSVARAAIENAIKQKPLSLDLAQYPQKLTRNGASFVTLTKHGALRGCIGTLQAYQPLVKDVYAHAVAAALEDYRFPPVKAAEMAEIHIEISILSDPVPLTYASTEALITMLRPGMDGVILQDGSRRATFLPQVWQQLPNAEEFLSHLCQKMGSPHNAWQTRHLHVEIYQVEEFHE